MTAAASFTMNQARVLYLEETRAENSPSSWHTYEWHARSLCDFWGSDRTLTSITRLEVQQWLNGLRSTCRPSTLRHKISALNRFFRVATDHTGELITAPTKELRKPPVNNQRERILLDDEEAKLRFILSPRDFSPIEFALQTGMRRVEQGRLRARDVRLYYSDPEDGGEPLLLGIAHVVTSKTGRGRQVPLNPVAAGIAKYWVDQGENYLFFGQSKNRYNAGSAWAVKHFREPLKTLGFKGLTWHDLRHTFATRALQGGARPEQISRMLGHTQLQMTQRYMHWAVDQLWPAAMATFNRPTIRDAKNTGPTAKWTQSKGETAPPARRPPTPALVGR